MTTRERKLERIRRAQTELSCDFCLRTQREVKTLIAGRRAYICADCTSAASAFLAEREAERRPVAGWGRVRLGLIHTTDEEIRMCNKCKDALSETFPEVPDQEAVDFLISVTAWPMGPADTIAGQLRELRAQTDDYRKCYGIVEREMDRLMESLAPDPPDRDPALAIPQRP